MNSKTRLFSMKRLFQKVGFTLSFVLATTSLVALNAPAANAGEIPKGLWTSIATSDDGTKIAAGAFNGGIWTSSDSGASWINRSTGSATLAAGLKWQEISMSSDGAKIAAVVRDGGIYTSSDFGATWEDHTSATGAKGWTGIASSNDGLKLVATSAITMPQSGEIWTSADGGATWAQKTLPTLANKAITGVASSGDGTKLAASYFGGIATSVDSGETWTLRAPPQGSANYTGIVSSDSGDRLSAVIYGNVLPQVVLSSDAGVTWTGSMVPSNNVMFSSIATSSDGTRLITAGYVSGAMYVSTDSGVSWTDISGNFSPYVEGSWTFASSDDGQKLVAGKGISNGCIYTSADSGATWKNRCLQGSPGAPGKPTVVEGDTTATVSWTASTLSPVTYTVTASPGGASCTATAPATTCTVTGLTNGTPYTFVVTATNAEGSTDSQPSDTVTIALKVTQVVPGTGAQAGGTAVTITGNLFAAGATVTIGGNACTNVVVVSATSITCETPAGTGGFKDVVVTNADSAQATKANGFRYLVVNPTVTTVAPNTGSSTGGTAITITGTGFVDGATVNIGTSACTSVVFVSATSITCVTPAGTAGATYVRVINPDGGFATFANSFTYIANPTATTIEPNTGSTAGGTSITITGTNFVEGATVTVGGAACTDVVVVSATSITCVTPAGTAGAKDVVVTNTNGGTVTSAAGFTYSTPFRSVTFNANGGTGTIANSSKNAASALPANTFARTGYVFKGWNTNAKGTGTAYANKASYSYSADLTLYAQWTAVPSGKKLSKNIATFAGDQAALTPGMKADIATWVKKLPTNATIQCVGSTQGDKVTAFDTKLATSRAKNVCVEAVKVRSDLKYTLKANPSTSTKAAARNVWIYQK